MTDIWINTGAAAAYGAVSLLVMLVSYLIVDVLTPGKLHKLIWEQKSKGASALVAVNLLSSAWIVRQAILSSNEGLAAGLLSTAVYSIVGIVLMAIAFLAVDALTPGKLGDVVTGDHFHPALLVTLAAHGAIALVMAAAIS